MHYGDDVSGLHFLFARYTLHIALGLHGHGIGFPTREKGLHKCFFIHIHFYGANHINFCRTTLQVCSLPDCTASTLAIGHHQEVC